MTSVRARATLLPLSALFSSCCLLAIATPASGAASTLYVGGTGCSDSGGGTQSQPYCTISAAAAAAVAGQTVLVSAGTYAEDVRPSRSGTAGAPITFTSVPGDQVVVTGSDHAFDVSYRSWITVTGFTSSATTSSGIYLKGSSHITVTQNTVTTAGQPVAGYTAYGIYVNASTDSLVQGNVAYGNSAAGIYLTGGSTRITVDGNESYANASGYIRSAAGIDLRSAGNTITHNRSHGNEDSGIQAYPGGDYNLIAGNVIYDNKGYTTTPESNCDHPASGASGCITGDHGIDDYDTIGNTINGNTVYGNVSAGINVEGVPATWLTAPVGPSDGSINVGTGKGFPTSGSFVIQLDAEQLTVTGGQDSTTWTVSRGANGTTPAAHGVGCDGTSCSPKNLNVLQYAGFSIRNNVSVDNAILCPDGNGGVQAVCNRTKGEIRVDQYSGVGTTADSDLVFTTSTGYPYVFTWGNPMYKTVSSLNVATGQEQRGRQGDPLFGNPGLHDFGLSPGSPAIDSADSSAPGQLATDAAGAPRADDPAVADTGTGPRTFDDRGAYEHQPPTRPAAPALTAVADDGGVSLSWTETAGPGATPVSGFDVYRGTSSGAEVRVASVGAGSTSYTDTGLSAATTYFYYVVATSAAGPSAPSNEVSATTTGTSPTPTPVPPTPLTLFFTNTSSASISGTKQMVTVAPSAETSHQTVIGTATGWGVINPGGTSGTWPAGAAEPGAIARGFVYESTPARVTLAAGSYSPSIKVKVVTAGVTATFATRVWLRHADGTYQLLARYQSPATALTTSLQVISSWTETQRQSATTTSSGDLLFADVAVNIATNTAGSAGNAITMALHGGAAESLGTPGTISTAGVSR